MTTTLYRFARNTPAKRISLGKLQKEVAVRNGEMSHASHRDELKDLGGGRYALLKHEFGFMEMIHHVAIYRAKAGFLQRDRLELVTTKEFETSEEAAGVFESLR